MLQSQRPIASWPVLLLRRVTAAVPRWLRWGIALVALALPVVAFRHGHEIKQFVKVRLSHWDIEQARDLLRDPVTAEEGIRLLVQALVRTPEDPTVLRTMAQTTAQVGLHAHSRFFYEHLSRLTPLTREDELQRARVLAALSDDTGARLVLQRLRASDDPQHPDPELLRAEADVATAANQPAQARAALEKVLRAAPGDSQTLFDLAKARATDPQQLQQQAGITELLDVMEKALAERDIPTRMRAFWTLSGLPISDPAQRARFATLIDRMPVLTLERRLTSHLLQASLDTTDPEKKALQAWLWDFIKRESPHASPDERLLVAKVMQQQGLHLFAIQWITHEQALLDSALCAARIDSLLVLKLWGAVLRLLDSPDVPLSQALSSLFRAQVMLASGAGKVAASVTLGEALRRAHQLNQQGHYIALASLAAGYGDHRVALEAYRGALQPQFPAATALVEPLLAIGRQAGASAGDMLLILRQRAEDEQWNRELELHFDHLAVLAGQDVELVLEKHREPEPAAPDFARRLLLHTLACHRLGDHAALAAALERLPAQQAWSPPQVVCLQALRHASGLPAEPVVLPRDTALFAEERRLLQVAPGATARPR